MEPAPQTPKYSARVDRSDVNTSHAIVMDLVGSGKRVLDVGCASGYLAEALSAAGNKVSGVELDPVAAEAARPLLDRLVVGDIEQLDLVDEFGAGAFDVVIFADVLEHLRDPVEVLRRARPLLAEGGYAVLSIPNVAHGSVRLALLRGRFEYRPVGLLDDTHLRFFTRDSFEQLIVDAGFYPADSRQTTAGPFDVETPLDRADFPPDLVASVEADPESWVYQFVARVEPIDTTAGSGPSAVALRQELRHLHHTLSEITRAAGAGAARPVIGVLDPGGEPDGALRSLRMALVMLEMRRRLAGCDLRAYSVEGPPAPSGIGDEVVETLVPGVAQWPALREAIHGLVVAPGPGGPGAATLLDEAHDAGMTVQRPGSDGPDPLVLVGRLLPAHAAQQRRTYLQITGQLPKRPYVLAITDSAADAAEQLTAALRAADRDLVAPAGPVSGLDLLGLVASADAVVTSSAGVAAIAVGLGRPVVATGTLADAVAGEGGAPWRQRISSGDAALAEMLLRLSATSADQDGSVGPDDCVDPDDSGPSGPGPRVASTTAEGSAVLGAMLASQVDRDMDALAEAATVMTAPRLPALVAARLDDLAERVRLLESVNAGLQSVLAHERAVMAAEVERTSQAPLRPEADRWAEHRAEQLAEELAAAGAAQARLQAEIDRIYATRTMRMVAPMRRIYGRIRSVLK